MKFLSEQWCATVLAQASGVDVGLCDASFTLTVTGGPDGKIQLIATSANGELTSLAHGTAATPESITLTTPWSEAVAIANGERVASVAFMLGTVKTDGPTGPLLALLRALDSDAVAHARNALLTDTDFS